MADIKKIIGEHRDVIVKKIGEYNEALKESLPLRGIEVIEIPRLSFDGIPVSASAVRNAYHNGDWEKVRFLVPNTTYEYLQTAQQEATQ